MKQLCQIQNQNKLQRTHFGFAAICFTEQFYTEDTAAPGEFTPDLCLPDQQIDVPQCTSALCLPDPL